MNKLIYSTILLCLAISCSKKLDLDDDTIILIEKQHKLTQLNSFFDLSFEDPQKAKTDYELFVKDELFTTNRNYLTDNDVRIANSYTSAVIQLNVGFEKIEAQLLNQNLFELYDVKFATYINNKALLGDIPLQFKNNERYQRIKEKIDYINAFFDERVAESIAKSSTDKNVAGKKWKLQKSFYDWDKGALHNINFDFVLNEDKTSDINSFFFIPFSRYSNVDEKTITDLKSSLLSIPKYAMYGNKICFYFELKDNIDYVRNTGNMERSWVLEFTYSVDGDKLVLFEPRKRLYLAPFYYNDNFDDEGFSGFYPAELQQFSLQANP